MEENLNKSFLNLKEKEIDNEIIENNNINSEEFDKKKISNFNWKKNNKNNKNKNRKKNVNLFDDLREEENNNGDINKNNEKDKMNNDKISYKNNEVIDNNINSIDNDKENDDNDNENFLNKKRDKKFLLNQLKKNDQTSNINHFKNNTQKTSSNNNNPLTDLHFKSTLELQNQNHAFNQEEINTEQNKDALSKLQRQTEITRLIKEGKLDPKFYRGKNSYNLYLEKSEKDINNSQFTGSLGPMRINTTIKTISQIDYAMGICKDFKNAGVCGYGDDCIFLHERGDIKSSWEIDREFRKKEARKIEMLKKGVNLGSGSGLGNEFSMGGDLGEVVNSSGKNQKLTITKLKRLQEETTCPICKKEMINPINTLCNHFFCESCALQNYNNKNKLCFICKKHLKGVFNSAPSVLIKIKLKNGYFSKEDNKDDSIYNENKGEEVNEVNEIYEEN